MKFPQIFKNLQGIVEGKYNGTSLGKKKKRIKRNKISGAEIFFFQVA